MGSEADLRRRCLLAGSLGELWCFEGVETVMFIHPVDENTTLAMVEMHDAEELFALVDDSRMYLREWLPWVDANVSIDETRAFVDAAHKQYARGDGFQCCIRYKSKIVGIIGLHRVDRFHKHTEIGYWLAEEYQGRGIMTACCRALVDFVFTEYRLHRVEIRAATGNQKSCAIPERLGFTLEGALRESEWVNDRFVDSAVYAMLDRDWSS